MQAMTTHQSRRILPAKHLLTFIWNIMSGKTSATKRADSGSFRMFNRWCVTTVSRLENDLVATIICTVLRGIITCCARRI